MFSNNIDYVIYILIFSVFIMILYLLPYNVDYFESEYNWKSVLKQNWIDIKSECIDAIKNVPITNENRNKYWDEINDTNVKNKWLLGHESIENTWLNYGLVIGYDFIDSNCEKCPKTNKILKDLVKNNVKIKVAGFSWLRPHSHIPFHTDPNDEVVYHLGLICPKNDKAYVHIKINNKDKFLYQRNGEIITFDDRYPHSAINNSNEERIILYLLID